MNEPDQVRQAITDAVNRALNDNFAYNFRMKRPLKRSEDDQPLNVNVNVNLNFNVNKNRYTYNTNVYCPEGNEAKPIEIRAESKPKTKAKMKDEWQNATQHFIEIIKNQHKSRPLIV